MKYKYLGRTGVQVSELCFGTMSFGGDADEETSEQMYRRCREAGINFFDCANVYAGGRSEELLGKFITTEREEVVITSKVYFPTGSDPNVRGASRRNIQLAVEKSLRRLKTDWIDIYFIHHFDEHTPIEDTLRSLDDLVRQGKILYPAVSNFSAWQIMKALGIAHYEQLARFEVIQPMYNLVKRQAEVEILPLALAEGLAVTPYSPLGGGLLTGKYATPEKPLLGRLLNNEMYATRYGSQWMFQAAADFAAFARSEGYSPASLAVAWVAAHPAVTSPIIGARNLGQLDESLFAVELEMTPELYEAVSAFSEKPAVATDRSEER
ncbi:MAG: aldo/keto reductase [Anaerolineae bacterium]|jgi:aryl-alcohol dehydrogenase-like predicted oxidoreductase|nr:aldo/keto reductase [Anaerolineae bacterium]